MESGTTPSAQEKFAREYITGTQIRETLNISRTTVSNAIVRGDLPKPFYVTCTFYLWDRNDVEPYIKRWKERQTPYAQR